MGRSANEIVVARRHSLGTGYVVYKLAHVGTAVVAAAHRAVIYLRRGCVAEVIVRLRLVAGKDFLPEAVWVEVTAVLRVAVSEAARREALAVVINHHGAEHNLIAPVPIDV